MYYSFAENGIFDSKGNANKFAVDGYPAIIFGNHERRKRDKGKSTIYIYADYSYEIVLYTAG